jgi:hypothetical protein
MINGFVFLKSTPKTAANNINKISPKLGIGKVNEYFLKPFLKTIFPVTCGNREYFTIGTLI